MTGNARVFTAARSTYVVGLACWGPLFAIWLIVFFSDMRHPDWWDRDSWLGVLIVLALGALLFSWIAAFRIELNEDRFLYRSLFGGRKSINLSDVESVKSCVGVQTYTDRLRPFMRLEIKGKPSAPTRRIDINLKVFSLEDLRELDKFFPARLWVS